MRASARRRTAASSEPSGEGRRAQNNPPALSLRSLQGLFPERKQMQMSPQTPHKASQREAASPGLNSPLHPVQLLPSRGKGSARIFSLQLEGGVEEARAFGSGRLRRAALVQRFVPSTPAAADGRRAGGCMALGTPRLGCGWDSEATEAGAAEMRVPRGRRSFQAHKGRAKPRRAQ